MIDVSFTCDCCQRIVDYVRGSMWHGDDRICRECFGEWYDPNRPLKDEDDLVDKLSIGNWIRKKHDLAPLA
jgi:hypothetical protein